MRDMTAAQVCAYYDRHPNLTLAELALATGKTVKELKAILMGGH